MKTLFQIRVSPDAPRLLLDDSFPHARELLTFDGTAKTGLFPDRECPARPERAAPWEQFHAVAPGVLALSEEAWERCEDMYYVLSMGTELIAAGDARHYFRIINPVSLAPSSGDPALPFDMRSFYAPVFRLPGREPTDLYCLSGTEVPGDEFRYCYDLYGFTGLTFTEVWRG